MNTEEFDWEAWQLKHDADRAKELAHAKKIIDLLEIADKDKEVGFSWSIYKDIGQGLATARQGELQCSFMEQFYNGWLRANIPRMVKILATLEQKQTETERSYGDIDWTIRRIKNDEDVTVYTIEDHCTCADINYFILIHDKKHRKIHARELHKKGDYPSARYPKKLNLRFWKDRNYSVDFLDEFHRSNLGGVYGDARDKGFIFSFDYGFLNSVDDGNIYYYAQQCSFFSRLESTMCELEEDEQPG